MQKYGSTKIEVINAYMCNAKVELQITPKTARI